MHLRTISHVLVSELAKSTEGKEYVRRTLNEIIERPDDMTEVLAYYINTYGKPIPNSIKKAWPTALANLMSTSWPNTTGKMLLN